MKEIKTDTIYSVRHMKRFQNTLKFMNDLDIKSSKILNLGPRNPLSDILKKMTMILLILA